MNGHAVLFATERTVVRRYEAAAERRVLAADPAVRRFSQWPDASDVAFAVSVAAMRDRVPFDGGGWMNVAIMLRDGGYVGDHALMVETTTAKIGIALLPAWRGRGIAGEVIAGSLALLRGHGVSCFRAEIDPKNVASLAAFERVGFVRVKLEVDDLGPFWLLERH